MSAQRQRPRLHPHEPRSMGLQRRILGPLLMLGTAAILLLVAGSAWLLRGIASDVARFRASSLTRAIDAAAQVSDTSGQLQRFVSTIAAEPDVRQAVIVAGTPPRIIFSSRRELLGKSLDALSLPARAAVHRARSREPEPTPEGAEIAAIQIGLSSPELSAARLAQGIAVVHLERGPLEVFVRQVALACLVAGLALTALWSLSTAKLLRRHVLRPIAALHAEVVAHSLAPTADPNTPKDELRDLHDRVRTGFSRLRATLTELETAKAAAQAEARARADFLAMMSHEVRTPLSGMVGVVQLLGETTLSRAQLDLVDVLANSTDSLLVVLNDVLDLAKIDADMLQVEQIVFSPGALLSSIRVLLEPTARKKGLKLEIQCGDRQALVSGDPTRLRQVLLNLTTNALKFTHVGQVTLAARRASHGSWAFSVEDTGVGMSQDYLPKLFDRFSQAEASTTRQYGGTGLGMSIANKLVELMGGKLEVNSQLGKGTRFAFALPLAPTAQPTRDPAAPHTTSPITPPITPPLQTPLRVLVAEDHEINQLVVLRSLQALGCEAELAADGEQAVALFSVSQFDLVLMDYQMPVLDGPEATRRIRSLEDDAGRRRTPIVALTASTGTEAAQSCQAADMDGYLTKPARKEQLRRILEQVRAARDQGKPCAALGETSTQPSFGA